MSSALMCRVVIAFLTGLLLGCVESRPTMLGAPIEGINHTSAAINRFSVNGNGGHNIGPYGGGGTQVCCAVMPVQWRPGLTVVVEWEKDPSPHDYATLSEPIFTEAWRERMKEMRKKNTRHRAVVEVPYYKVLGIVDVHFLPCDQVLVSAVPELPGTPGYPYKFPRRMEVPSTCPAP